MEKVFSTRYICAGGNGKKSLKTYQGRLLPGRQFHIEDADNVLLAGGFQDLSPETNFHLSPTLQLQADLTPADDEELYRLAAAELQRAESVRIHSYILEADPRVCVLGDSGPALDAFCDTYGGVLDIRPLLIGATDVRYPVVVEYDLEKTDEGARLRYRHRMPVAEDRCSYCGDCAAVCPEKCISPDLTIDYDRCTFCRECEKVCSHSAMDIHAVEEVTVEVPACILLGNVKIDSDKAIECVYGEKDLPRFFRTVYGAEIEEVVCHNNSICQYSGRLGVGCGRCIDSCEQGALSRDGSGIRIDHLLCTECGSCISACPTGAMQNGFFEDDRLIGYLEEIGGGKGRDLVIGSEKELHSLWWHGPQKKSETVFYLEYPMVQALSFFHLLLFYGSGFRRIIVIDSEDRLDNSPLSSQADKANAIFISLFQGEKLAHITTLKGLEAVLQSGVAEPAAAAMPAGPFANRRAALTAVLKHLIELAGDDSTAVVPEDSFLSLNIAEEECTQCLACLNECKVGALQAEEQNMVLSYSAGLCVGCGVCVQVCPEKVLSLATVASIDTNYFMPFSLATAEPATCKRCGKVYGTRRSLDKVLAILASRESVNREHFEYCSTCRVVNLFEEETT